MVKNYKDISFLAGETIEEAVKELLNYKSKGLLVKGEFNGVTLYSDTVTMDGAYKDITGKTKAEFDRDQKNWRDEYDRKEKEHKEKIPELAKMWMKKKAEKS